MHYLDRATSTSYRPQTIESAVEFLREVDFDTVVVSGVSGLLVGPAVAHLLGKKIAVVRKRDDVNNHSCGKVEGYWGYKYVIIDDFVASGRTVRFIVDQMKSYAHGCECVGFYSYHPNEWDGMKPEVIAEKFQKAGVRFLNPPEPLPELPPAPAPEPPNPQNMKFVIPESGERLNLLSQLSPWRREPTMREVKEMEERMLKSAEETKNIWGMPKLEFKEVKPSSVLFEVAKEFKRTLKAANQ